MHKLKLHRNDVARTIVNQLRVAHGITVHPDAALDVAAQLVQAEVGEEPSGDLVSLEEVLRLTEHVLGLPTLSEKHSWVDCLPGKLRALPRVKR